MSNTELPNDEIAVLRNEVKELKAKVDAHERQLRMVIGDEKQFIKTRSELMEMDKRLRKEEREREAKAAASTVSESKPNYHSKPAPADCKQQ